MFNKNEKKLKLTKKNQGITQFYYYAEQDI